MYDQSPGLGMAKCKQHVKILVSTFHRGTFWASGLAWARWIGKWYRVPPDWGREEQAGRRTSFQSPPITWRGGLSALSSVPNGPSHQRTHLLVLHILDDSCAYPLNLTLFSVLLLERQCCWGKVDTGSPEPDRAEFRSQLCHLVVRSYGSYLASLRLCCSPL